MQFNIYDGEFCFFNRDLPKEYSFPIVKNYIRNGKSGINVQQGPGKCLEVRAY